VLRETTSRQTCAITAVPLLSRLFITTVPIKYSVPFTKLFRVPDRVCVYYCSTYYKAVRVGGGGWWRTCATRDDEPRPVWTSQPEDVCVYYCSTYSKAVRAVLGRVGGREIVEDICYERRHAGLCGLVCPSRTSERGGEGDCVKEGGGEEGKLLKCERERALVCVTLGL
jgi:hypothetical protein